MLQGPVHLEFANLVLFKLGQSRPVSILLFQLIFQLFKFELLPISERQSTQAADQCAMITWLKANNKHSTAAYFKRIKASLVSFCYLCIE